MKRLGYIHNMMDVKVLILFVDARSNYPLSIQEIYELCYQDDCLSYFDVCTAVPEMVQSGHLKQAEEERYEITEKGRQDGSAYTVKRKAEDAVDKFNRQIRRSSYMRTQLIEREGGDYSVIMSLDDEKGNLMTLELLAPDRRQAMRLSKLYEQRAEDVYKMVMTVLLDDEDELED